MQGGPLGGGEDPYWDAGRLGGTLSHLAREHPPTGAAGLHATVAYSNAARGGALRTAGCG